jgi:hypothetical protein
MPVYTFIHNLLNVVVQIANKMGLQKKISKGHNKKILDESEVILDHFLGFQSDTRCFKISYEQKLQLHYIIG